MGSRIEEGWRSPNDADQASVMWQANARRMAKVTYIDPIKSVSGKLTKTHSTVLNVRKAATNNEDMIANPCYTSWRDPSKKVQLSAGQVAWNETFKTICANTRSRMKDPSKINADQIAFAAQSKYKTLYSYVWNQVKNELV